MTDITLHLSKQQLRKYKQGKPIQLTHKQLMGHVHSANSVAVPFSLDPKTYKKLHCACQKGKGMRLGGSLLSTIGSLMGPVGAAMGAVNTARRIATTAENIVKALPTRTRKSLNKVVDGIVHADIKKAAAGAYEVAKSASHGLDVVNKFTGGEISDLVDVPRIKPQKGSDEMKARMQALRNSKKKPVAGSNLINDPDNVEIGGDLISFKKAMRQKWKGKFVPEAHKRLLKAIDDAVAEHGQQGGSFAPIKSKGTGFKPISGN